MVKFDVLQTQIELAVQTQIRIELEKQQAQIEGFPVMRLWSRVFDGLDLSDIIETFCQ